MSSARWKRRDSAFFREGGVGKSVLREVNLGADTDTMGYVAGGVWLGDRALSSPRHS